MHMPARQALTFLAIGTLSGCALVPSRPATPAPRLHIADVVAAIQQAVEPYWSPTDQLPPLASVKIALQAVTDDKWSVEGDYLIVAVKGFYDYARTQEVDVLLAKPPHRLGLYDLNPLPADVEKALATAIAGARHQIAATYTANGHTLSTQQIDVQIGFQVTWDVSGGIGKWALLPVSLSAAGEHVGKTVDTITVTFKTP